MSEEDPDDYFLPLEDQRVFGAGIRRRRVKFVPAQNVDSTASQYQDNADRAGSLPPSDVADRYLALVLKNTAPAAKAGDTTPGLEKSDQTEAHQADEHGSRMKLRTKQTAEHDSRPTTSTTRTQSKPCDELGLAPEHEQIQCEVCNRWLPNASVGAIRQHEASFAHQVSLPHSHPVSSVDRSRSGFKYLRSHGWDPDARVGLGSTGQGIRAPIKPSVKQDTAGLGIDVKKLRQEGKAVAKPEKLNAKQVRHMEHKLKKKGERLHRMFYASAEIEKYLGPQEE
ncbi:hypothetical protein KEM52_001102 [Ascosphaera acerosa]|nr:hypothetical protein KEM52_001102 [Ascosphaera acerosa]